MFPDKKFILLVFYISCANYLFSQESNTYTDSRDVSIYLPFGERSFADKVVQFINGKPNSTDESINTQNALSVPTYYGNPNDKTIALSLGCGGEVIFEFTDNALVDVKGPDLYIFEVGLFEDMDIYIGTTLGIWDYVGRTKGGTASIDISAVAEEKKRYHYVKIVDLKSSCNNDMPGADIDAIAAIGAVPSNRHIEKPVVKAEKPVIRKSKKIYRVNSSFTKSDTAEIWLWDGQQEDEDKVNLYLNDEILLANYVLNNEPKKMQINLIDGENKVQVEAISCGKLGDNSATLRLFTSNLNEIMRLKCKTGERKTMIINKVGIPAVSN